MPKRKAYSAAAAKAHAAADTFSAAPARRASAGVRVRALVGEITEILRALPDARREAMELVAALHDMPRHWPMLQAEERIDPAMRKRALDAAAKRAAGAPLQYAVGHADFRALTLHVDERVLIPRPETELLVDLVLKRVNHGVALDIGTGSGAIAIALATEGAFEHVLATDISSDAVAVASANASRLGAGVEFCQGDLLHALPISAFRLPLSVIVSNPPYISFDEIAQLPASVRDWEPAVALFSANGGMDATARLVRQAAERLEHGGLLALEVDARRASLVAEQLATDERYDNVTVELDLTGRERFVLANRRTRTS